MKICVCSNGRNIRGLVSRDHNYKAHLDAIISPVRRMQSDLSVNEALE